MSNNKVLKLFEKLSGDKLSEMINELRGLELSGILIENGEIRKLAARYVEITGANMSTALFGVEHGIWQEAGKRWQKLFEAGLGYE